MKLPPLIYNSIGKFFFFVLLETLCIILIINNSIVQRYRIMVGVRAFQSFFWEKGTDVKNYTQLRKANRELLEENAKLLEQNTLFREALEKNKGEQKLVTLADQIENNIGDSAASNYTFVLAKVIKNTLNSEHNYLILDKGSKDGITEDLGVITPSAVVGITRAVGPHYSYVYSFLNLRQSISAKIGSSDAYGSLHWEGGNIHTAYLTEIPLSVSVGKGDLVYTSGNSSFFPSDIPVGKSVSYSILNGVHKRVKVELLQDFSHLDYVIIVKNQARREIDSLSAIKPALNTK